MQLHTLGVANKYIPSKKDQIKLFLSIEVKQKLFVLSFPVNDFISGRLEKKFGRREKDLLEFQKRKMQVGITQDIVS